MTRRVGLSDSSRAARVTVVPRGTAPPSPPPHTARSPTTVTATTMFVFKKAEADKQAAKVAGVRGVDARRAPPAVGFAPAAG